MAIACEAADDDSMLVEWLSALVHEMAVGRFNRALANRQVLTRFARRLFARFLPGEPLPARDDVSHNTCKVEERLGDGW